MVESQSAWVGPSSKLVVPMPVTAASRFLYLEFEVLSGKCVDFDLMLENTEDESAVRLYGPSRRAHSVRTVLPLPHTGMAHATFDNFSSWLTWVELKYTMRLSDTEPAEHATFSRLRFGDLVGRDGELAQLEAQEEEDEEEEARAALKNAKPCELKLAAGAQEEIELMVASPTNMYVSVDVIKGRDVDFGVMLLPDYDADAQRFPSAAGNAASGSASTAPNEVEPIRLFGPCRRATSLSANILVPQAGTVVLGFDNSGMWFSSKTVRFRARLGDGRGVSGVSEEVL